MQGKGFIGYPTGWLLAVVDDPVRAEEMAASLREGTSREVLVLVGKDAAARFDGLGRRGGRSGLRRAIQQLAMDQMPDFLWYEEAVRQGRAVVAVHEPTEGRREQLVSALLAGGAHFINYFGPWATESIAPWRGPEPDVPHIMRR